MTLPVNVIPLALLIVRLFKFAALDGINTPAVVPPNIRLEAAVVTKFVGVPAIVGPFSVSVFAQTVKVPDVRVRIPPTLILPDSVLLPLPEIVRL